MSSPQSKSELTEQLRQVQQDIFGAVQGMSPEQFNSGTDEAWSASGYLKHLILSVKLIAKAFNLPPVQLGGLFGQPDEPSRTYDEVISLYQSRLDDGIRAEDFDRVTPSSYRMPEGITNEQEYLAQTWNDGNNKLLNGLEDWDEDDLDRYQLPHAAIGMVTMREMLFFTLHHNTLHWHDIEATGRNAQALPEV